MPFIKLPLQKWLLLHFCFPSLMELATLPPPQLPPQETWEVVQWENTGIRLRAIGSWKKCECTPNPIQLKPRERQDWSPERAGDHLGITLRLSTSLKQSSGQPSSISLETSEVHGITATMVFQSVNFNLFSPKCANSGLSEFQSLVHLWLFILFY